MLDATLNIGNFTPRSDSIQHAALATSINSTGQVAGFFDGRIDEARVWNVARSQGQIATARDLQVTSGTGLVARWGLNEGTGSSSPTASQADQMARPSVARSGCPARLSRRAQIPRRRADRSRRHSRCGPHRPRLERATASPTSPATTSIATASCGGRSTVHALAAGDIASCSSTGDEATAALLDSRPGDVLALGDNVYEDGTLAEFNNCYDPTWGRRKARTHAGRRQPRIPDRQRQRLLQLLRRRRRRPSQGYYSYDYGTWHVIVLNSNCANVSCAAGSAQEQWLRADLAATRRPMHAGLLAPPALQLGRLARQQPVDRAALAGALRLATPRSCSPGTITYYERFAPQTPGAVADPLRGIRQFVVGHRRPQPQRLRHARTQQPGPQRRHVRRPEASR